MSLCRSVEARGPASRSSQVMVVVRTGGMGLILLGWSSEWCSGQERALIEW